MPTLNSILYTKLRIFFSTLSISPREQKRMLALPPEGQFELITSIADRNTKTLLFVEIYGCLLIILDGPINVRSHDKTTKENSKKFLADFQTSKQLKNNCKIDQSKKYFQYSDESKENSSPNISLPLISSQLQPKHRHFTEIINSLPQIFTFLSKLIEFAEEHIETLAVIPTVYQIVETFRSWDGLGFLYDLFCFFNSKNCAKSNQQNSLDQTNYITNLKQKSNFQINEQSQNTNENIFITKKPETLKLERKNTTNKLFHKFFISGNDKIIPVIVKMYRKDLQAECLSCNPEIEENQNKNENNKKKNILGWFKTLLSIDDGYSICCCDQMISEMNRRGLVIPNDRKNDKTKSAGCLTPVIPQNKENEKIFRGNTAIKDEKRSENIKIYESKVSKVSEENKKDLKVSGKDPEILEKDHKISEMDQVKDKKVQEMSNSDITQNPAQTSHTVINPERSVKVPIKVKKVFVENKTVKSLENDGNEKTEQIKFYSKTQPKTPQLSSPDPSIQTFLSKIKEEYTKLLKEKETLTKEREQFANEKRKFEWEKIQFEEKVADAETKRHKPVDSSSDFPSLDNSPRNNTSVNNQTATSCNKSPLDSSLQSKFVKVENQKKSSQTQNNNTNMNLESPMIRVESQRDLHFSVGSDSKVKTVSRQDGEEENKILGKIADEQKNDKKMSLEESLKNLRLKKATNDEENGKDCKSTDEKSLPQSSNDSIRKASENLENEASKKGDLTSKDSSNSATIENSTTSVKNTVSATKAKPNLKKKLPPKKKVVNPLVTKLAALSFKTIQNTPAKNAISYDDIINKFTVDDFASFKRETVENAATHDQNSVCSIQKPQNSLLDIKKSNAIAFALHTQKIPVDTSLESVTLRVISQVMAKSLKDENFLAVLYHHFPSSDEILRLKENEPTNEAEKLFKKVIDEIEKFKENIINCLLELRFYNNSKPTADSNKNSQLVEAFCPLLQDLKNHLEVLQFILSDKLILYVLKLIKFITTVVNKKCLGVGVLKDEKLRELVIKKVLDAENDKSKDSIPHFKLQDLEMHKTITKIKLKNLELLQTELTDILDLHAQVKSPIVDISQLQTYKTQIETEQLKIDALFGEQVTEKEIDVVMKFYEDLYKEMTVKKD